MRLGTWATGLTTQAAQRPQKPSKDPRTGPFAARPPAACIRSSLLSIPLDGDLRLRPPGFHLAPRLRPADSLLSPRAGPLGPGPDSCGCHPALPCAPRARRSAFLATPYGTPQASVARHARPWAGRGSGRGHDPAPPQPVPVVNLCFLVPVIPRQFAVALADAGRSWWRRDHARRGCPSSAEHGGPRAARRWVRPSRVHPPVRHRAPEVLDGHGQGHAGRGAALGCPGGREETLVVLPLCEVAGGGPREGPHGRGGAKERFV